MNSRPSKSEDLKRRKKLRMLVRTHKKIYVSFVLVFIMLLSLGIRIFMINYNHGDEYSQVVLDHQSYKTTSIPYKRGNITTSDGTIIAYSEKVYNLILDVKDASSDDECLENTLNALTTYFPLNRNDLMAIIKDNPKSQYQKLLKGLTAEEISEFSKQMSDDSNKIKGVWFEEDYTRKYPFNSLACDVVGFASNANGGELGLESQYDEELTGNNGVSYKYVDEGLDTIETTRDAIDGNNIVTTIDYNVQTIIEKYIAAYNKEKPSTNTAVMVMNPSNGEILGMASYPVFNLNNPRNLTGIIKEEELSTMTDELKTTALYKLWTNYCVSQGFEPGSTYKTFTVAAGLEDAAVHDGDTYVCKGYEEIGEHTVKCHSYTTLGSHGELTLQQALENSCNPYMIHIIDKLGNKRFAQYEKMFGFGQKTGVDLPGETTGITYDEEKITTIDAATNSFGQNVTVNMVQLMSAYNSLIMDGKYYQPHIVKRIESPSGEVIKENTPVLVRQTITPSTSSYLRKYLETTVSEGTAGGVRIQGYSIAGKTGTAQKLPRDDLTWIASFVGHAPAENPKFSIYVVIDEPFGTTGTGGSASDSLRLAKDILNDLLPYMGVYKDTDKPYVDPADAPVESGVVDVPGEGDNGQASANGSTQNNSGSNNPHN